MLWILRLQLEQLKLLRENDNKKIRIVLTQFWLFMLNEFFLYRLNFNYTFIVDSKEVEIIRRRRNYNKVIDKVRSRENLIYYLL